MASTTAAQKTTNAKATNAKATNAKATNAKATNAKATNAKASSTARKASAPRKAKAFSIVEWKGELTKAAKAERSAASMVLDCLITVRDKGYGEKDIRAMVRDAFADAGWQDKTLQKRTSDAMAIFKAAKLPDDMPKNLQRAADACRALNPSKPRKPRAGTDAPKAGKVDKASSANKADDAPSKDVEPLDIAKAREALRGTINGMLKRADDEAADWLATMMDMLDADVE